eukprot:gene58582-78147_t
MEHALITEYQATVGGLLSQLNADNLAQAVAIASIPEDIRGYGHVKERHLKAAKQKEATLLANFGNASGKAPPVDLGLLAAKGSLYVTRPTLFTHIATRENTQAMADDLFAVVQSGAVKIPIDQRYALDDVQQAHRDLEARKTTGCTILTL